MSDDAFLIRPCANDPVAALSARQAAAEPRKASPDKGTALADCVCCRRLPIFRCDTPDAEDHQCFMMLQAATALHQPLISYKAIFAVAHAREPAIPEVVSG